MKPCTYTAVVVCGTRGTLHKIAHGATHSARSRVCTAQIEKKYSGDGVTDEEIKKRLFKRFVEFGHYTLTNLYHLEKLPQVSLANGPTIRQRHGRCAPRSAAQARLPPLPALALALAPAWVPALVRVLMPPVCSRGLPLQARIRPVLQTIAVLKKHDSGGMKWCLKDELQERD